MSNQICLDGVEKTVDQSNIWRDNGGSALVQTWSNTPLAGDPCLYAGSEIVEHSKPRGYFSLGFFFAS